jgi:CelD/BcsL family acetyltransferase involved in cellulose biosynthesis
MALAILEINDLRWASFVETQPGAVIFQHPNWAALIARCYEYRSRVIAILDEFGQIVAGLPFLEVPGLLSGRRWISLPFSDYCQPLAADQRSLELLTDTIVLLHTSKQLSDIEIKWALPERQGIYPSSKFVLHTLPLSSPPEDLYKKFRKGHRYDIKKALEGGVEIKRSVSKTGVDEFYRLHLKTRQRLGVPIQPRKFFDMLWENLISTGMGFILLALHHNAPIAGAIFFSYNRTLTYKYSASDQRFWKLYPNNLLLWEAIQIGCESGCKQFDLGNSEKSNHGLRSFKSGFGAYEEELVYSFLGNIIPDQNSGSLRKVMNWIISHSPPLVCQLTGQLLYRYYG